MLLLLFLFALALFLPVAEFLFYLTFFFLETDAYVSRPLLTGHLFPVFPATPLGIPASAGFLRPVLVILLRHLFTPRLSSATDRHSIDHRPFAVNRRDRRDDSTSALWPVSWWNGEQNSAKSANF